MRAATSFLVLGLWSGSHAALAAEEPAEAVYARAVAAASAKDAAGIETALSDIEAILVATPGSAVAHFTRGWILSRSGKSADAVAEYDAAYRLAPTFANAAYNAGVLLMGAGRVDAAIERLQSAVVADPGFEDAQYNLGQAYYDRGDYAKALSAWTRVRELAPKDFQAAKKRLQALNALGDFAAAAQARKDAIEIWRESTDPDVRNLEEFVFDQFEAGGYHVYAFENLGKASDRGYLYSFKIADRGDRVVGAVRLEPGLGFEAQGVAWILGIEKAGAMFTPGPAFKDLPGYEGLKPIVLKAIAEHFGQ